MSYVKILKGSLAVTVLKLVMIFPITATPLFPNIPDSPPTAISNEMPDLLSKDDADYPSVSEWRRYDINLDGKFDVNDIDLLMDQGWQDFDYDLNEDGVKDFDDALALFLKLSVMDRSCDKKVTDEDYEPVSPVRLPEEPDYSKVQQIVSNCIFRSLPKPSS